MSADNVECPIYGCNKTFHVIVRMRPPSWIFLKEEKKFQRSQILTNAHKKWHRLSSDQSAQKLGDLFFNFNFVRLLQPIKISGEGAVFDVSSYLRNALVKQNQM